ncbi:MAG: tetratricopeptide repeat protein [Thermoanaerobaculia bacterium]|nr:tetratricopeptide repeat protein [Thermoanaerobaculia bacterium]
MSKLFISHSTADDGFVRELRWALADLQQDAWIDSRELRAGDPLWPEIQKAIEEAAAVAVVVSPHSLQARWVGKELGYALELQQTRGRRAFPVFLLSLDGTKLGVLEEFFESEPLYISVSSAAGGVEAALNPILVAMGVRDPAEVPVPAPPKLEPLEELVLELSDLEFFEQDQRRRASARARLVYEPATAGRRRVASEQTWRLVAPMGPIETEEVRWYLEKYAIWPSEYFRERASRVEAALEAWGRLLYDAALPAAHRDNVLEAWSQIDDHAGRRFSIEVDASVEAGTSAAEAAAVREAATLLLGLPWELLHDGDGFLFQGAKPVRVRRRLPNTRPLDIAVVAAPIRVLLVTARPEDEACGYLDHRASALPLVEAMEELGGLVRLHVLSPPTSDALGKELKRAFDAREPYHVVHFDGHGVYDRTVGLGGLCFESPQDSDKLEQRRHVTVFTDKLGPLLKDFHVPIVFLEACQTALAEETSESVASELLQRGVASVVAMSHSVLVETARRFVEVFYGALAAGRRVGDAMLEGQRHLKDDTFRGRFFGVGELRLEDWFVPVLFQDKEDPQLFESTPAPQTQADLRTLLASRLGALPPAPTTGFIGRSRELLALERLLRHERYAVVRGQGGEGKTALAAEFACWMVRSQQIRRAAFVSVESHGHVAALVDALGRQLVGKAYSFATFESLDKALQPVERALREQGTLLVVDNMESVLLPPYLETPEALSEEAGRELEAILALCARLLKVGDTRLVFTSREPLPAPFDSERHRRELHRLDSEDAVKLVEAALSVDGTGAGAALDAQREAIEDLVDAVHGHARTLALLAPHLRSEGVAKTHTNLAELMSEMDQRYPPGTPGAREKSVFASVELSLRRLSPENWERVGVLGVFHGGVQLGMLRLMMGWEVEDVAALAGELIATGLATPNRYDHLSLNPALCPYLRGRLDAAEREELTGRWVGAMGAYVESLVQEQSRNIEVAATLTGLELPNLFALLDRVHGAGDAEASINLATSLYGLLQNAGKSRLLVRVGQVRDAAERRLGEELGGGWNHARFEAARTRIDQQLAGEGLREALDGAQQLLRRARAEGEGAYPGADYDLAMALFTMARMLKSAGGAEQALPLLKEALRRFGAMAKERPGQGSERMASVCVTEQGDCFRNLGRLEEAAAAYEEGIRRDEESGAERDVAVGKAQLGTARLWQRRYSEALEAFAEARERFTQLDEPSSVAVSWHQTGMVYQEASDPEAAEDAYRRALAIEVRLGDVSGQGGTLNQLGNLYSDILDRPEEAVPFFRQAVDKSVEGRDMAKEGLRRSNLAGALRKLGRLDEGRQEIQRSIQCKAQVGVSAALWTSWAVLAEIEKDAGNPAAATVAKGKAVSTYLAHRCDGGENHNPDGRLCLHLTQLLLGGDPGQAAALLKQEFPRYEAAGFGGFVRALQKIVAGSRDRALAEDPELHFTMAAEILFLIETLENAGR